MVSVFLFSPTPFALAAGPTPFLGPAKTYDVGRAPYAMAVGDFNKDGRMDLAVANIQSNHISILINSGGGIFQPQVKLGIGKISESVLVGDFNGDGNPDLVVGVGDGSKIILGNGDGTFQQPFFLSGGSARVTADFNGDGKLDLAYFTAFDVDVQLGNGDGTFQPPVVSPTQNQQSLLVMDFNGDGKPDLLASLTSSGISGGFVLLLGKGDGSFQTPLETDTALGGLITAADFNDDGKVDVALATFGGDSMGLLGKVALFLGNGDGTFQTERDFDYEPGDYPTYIIAADFNGDGKSDVAVANAYGNDVSIILGNGDGTFQFTTQAWSAERGPFPVAGDFNGDGLTDLAVANYGSGNVSILLNRKTGFSSSYDIYAGGLANFVASGDLNGDGLSDLVFADADGIGVSLARKYSFNSTVHYALPPGNYATVALGDLNHDGCPDLVTAVHNQASVLLNNTDGTFHFSAKYAIQGADAKSVAFGDFNGDGNMDVSIADDGYISYGKVSLLLGNGDGSLQNAYSLNIGQNSPSYITAGDFNRDGKLDLAVITESLPGTLFLLLGNGDGTFQPPTAPLTISDAFATFEVAADLNRDGNLDLVIVDAASKVGVLLGNGDGTFQPLTTYPVSFSPVSLAVADFDGDGNLDLAVESSSYKAMSLLNYFAGKGDGTFSTAQSFRLSSIPSWMTAGDFNGDGHPDVAVVNEDAGSATILLNSGR